MKPAKWHIAILKIRLIPPREKGKKKGLAEGMEKGLAEGMEKGLAEGMEKGMSQRSLEIARTMLAKGMDAATVMEITGLSERQLKQLKE